MRTEDYNQHWWVTNSSREAERVSAASCVLEAGALVFYDISGELVRAFSPSGWLEMAPDA